MALGGPGANGAFAFGFGNGFGCGIAESKQNAPGFFSLAATQFAERGTERFQAKIVLAGGAFHAVEKGGDFNHLVPRVKKIEVNHLLFGHNIYDLLQKCGIPIINRKS